jgi:hypothetical protein
MRSATGINTIGYPNEPKDEKNHYRRVLSRRFNWMQQKNRLNIEVYTTFSTRKRLT